jgi:hypothetical protein
MSKQYITDVLTISEIVKWKKGDRILITSQTGSGKSQWIKDQLYQYCKSNDKKILLLSNRTALKNQNINEIGEDKSDIITLKNYQTLENSYLYGNTVDALFNNYDYICYDEVHYLLSDSPFNANTDILMNPIKFPSKDKIFIFLTATPQAITRYNSTYEFKYTIETNYDYIENLFFYSRDETVENILRSIPYNEKAIYFGTALDAFELSNKFSESEFICSNNNREFNNRSSKSTVKDIETNNDFKCRFLFSTKVLDNGINIISPMLKHIIIDMIDPIDVIQCLGRKRSLEDENITLYIKTQNGRDIYNFLYRARNRLKLVKERDGMTKEEFQNKYARKPIDSIIMNNGEINVAKLFYSKYVNTMFSKMMGDKDKEGYQKEILKILSKNTHDIKLAENYFEKKTLDLILESYLGKRIYRGEELDAFKTIFFENIFSPKRKIDIRNRGTDTINSILYEDRSQYRIQDNNRDWSNDYKGKRYWIVYKLPT